MAWPTEGDRDKQAALLAQAVLGNEAFTREQAVGRTLSRDQLIVEADTIAAEADKPAPAAMTAAAGGLSSRELEVLRLVVAGRTDREIADALFISPRTASKHVGSILAKLDAASRAEAAATAVRDGLI